MFSRNTYLFPPSLHPRTTTTTTPFVDLNGVEYLLHHHPELFTGSPYLAANIPPVIETSLNQHGGETSAMGANTSFQTKPTPKKDRHSKIYTSQGPRDRRVRLSIGIARKFFDLQEMLGFDKPSKTLDWLLTKSKTAIKELVMQTKEKTKSSSGPSSPFHECEMLSSSAGNGINSFNGADSERKLGKENPQQTVLNLAKESRAKARARARERTKEKMNIKQINGGRNIDINGSDYSNSLIPIQYMRNNHDLEVFQLSGAGSSSNNVSSCPLSNEDLIQESTMNKRRPKNNPSSFFGFNQQNAIVSRDLMSSSYGVQSANSSSQNWDNIYAILDQHKFINSTSNI